jgi:phosphatidylserine decarboxylase
MDEAEHPLGQYRSINELFVRRLRPGIHRWPGNPEVLASPVDGVLGELGQIRDGILVQAKGREYGVAELLGEAGNADVFRDGAFVTLYLSPRHYHRIHTPLPGVVRRARHVPGGLLPVNRPAVQSIERLFARNERLVATLETAVGRVEVVAVGAYNVGRISAAFDPSWSGTSRDWITNRTDPPPRERRYPRGIRVDEGDELMAFHLGSTVILLTEPGLVLEPGLRPGAEVRVGDVLARPGS